MTALRGLSLDAKVIGGLALLDWAGLLANQTVVQVSRDGVLWLLFPGVFGPAWLVACGLVALLYPLRDHLHGAGFTSRARWLHLWAMVVVFVLVPAIAMIVLRETGKPYTYVHDGAIMVEEAARKLLAGQSPYVADYLDTPLFYWPMINNPALYHFTYFPLTFLATAPFVALFDRVGAFWDQRYLYLPAFLATLPIVQLLLPKRADARLALVALVALDPQLFPFVAEGRNDVFVLLPLFAGVVLLQRERRALGLLAIASAAASKLHAGLLLPFVLAYLWWKDAALPAPVRVRRLALAVVPGAIVLAATFLPFLIRDFAAFWDDVVSYNAGGAAWSYPISGMGFSAFLLSIGVIAYPQQDFPFWIFELAAAAPVALWALARLRREPTIDVLLGGYALTLLAFLFFGRYFNGNHLGFIAAVAAPVPFLRPDLIPSLRQGLLRPVLRVAPVAVPIEEDRAA